MKVSMIRARKRGIEARQRLESLAALPIRVQDSDMLDLYVEHLLARRLAPRTIDGYEKELRALQQNTGSRLANLRHPELKQYWSSLCSSELKSSTLERKLIAWRCFWKWAENTEFRASLSEPRPYIGLVVPKGEERLKNALHELQVESLVRAFNADTYASARDSALAALLLWTGVRTEEVTRLNVEHFDWGDVPTLRIFGKGKKDRDVPLPAKLMPWLRRWRLHHQAAEGAFFVDADGMRMNAAQLRGALRRVAGRAGLEHLEVTPLLMRHTYATRLERFGVPMMAIKHFLGHASLATTQLYIHASLSEPTLRLLDGL